jgi:hypothetical protein
MHQCSLILLEWRYVAQLKLRTVLRNKIDASKSRWTFLLDDIYYWTIGEELTSLNYLKKLVVMRSFNHLKTICFFQIKITFQEVIGILRKWSTVCFRAIWNSTTFWLSHETTVKKVIWLLRLLFFLILFLFLPVSGGLRGAEVGNSTAMIESSDNTVSRVKLFTLFFSSNFVHPVRFFEFCSSCSFLRILFVSSNIVQSNLLFEYCSGSWVRLRMLFDEKLGDKNKL